MKSISRKKRRNLGRCDICKEKATKILSFKNCDYCADWFIGHFCKKCFDLQYKAFLEEYQEQEAFRLRCNGIKTTTVKPTISYAITGKVSGGLEPHYNIIYARSSTGNT